MSIDRRLLGNYISSKLLAPRNLIFISDRATIFPRDGSLRILKWEYPIVFFDTDLAVRDKLEIYKDNWGQRRFIIISQTSEAEEVALLDYIVRSNHLIVIPKDVLEFVQKGYQWTDEVNLLGGEDFWEIFENLKLFRLQLEKNISPIECSYIVVSALLDIDLTGKIAYRDAIEVWQICREASAAASPDACSLQNTACRLGKYPTLLNILKRRLQSLFPLLAKLTDEDFVRFLWTANRLDAHSPRALSSPGQQYKDIPVTQIKRLRDQLVKNHPALVIEHVKRTEEWLASDAKRIGLFRVGVGEADPMTTAQFAAHEHILCSPLRDALRNLAEHISLSPDILPEGLISDVLANIENHLFWQDNTNYLKIKDTFNAFSCLIELSRLVKKVKGLPKDDIWVIYPEHLSRLEYLRDRFESLNFKCALLKDALMRGIFRKIEQLLEDYNAAFAQLVKTDYAQWLSGKGKAPLLAKDFLPSLFLPNYGEYVQGKERTAYIILFDGMRWDCWYLIKPRLRHIFDGKLKLKETAPLLSTLPTATEYAKRALFGLSDISTSEWHELETFKKSHIPAQTITDFGQNLDQIVQLIEDAEVSVKVLNFPLVDPRLHNCQRNLSTLYEEILVYFQDIVEPCLERISPDSLVFVLSDHGFIEIKGKPRQITDKEVNVKKRYLEVKSFSQLSSLPEEVVLFDADDIFLPANVARYGLATSNAYFIHPGSETYRYNRYAHGGISMQEMIVPCAIFVPEERGKA